VLRAAGLNVLEVPGWQKTAAHGDEGKVLGGARPSEPAGRCMATCLTSACW